jgi:ADP-ribose pyrophosphatase YjhB (NUDIX family)
MKSRLNVVCIIEHDGKVLLGRKAQGVGPYQGKWLIPGGGVDTDRESVDDAMRREIFEETNLRVTGFERLSFSEDVAERHGEMTRLVFLYYRVVSVTDWSEVKPGDDLVELRWFPYVDLSEIPVPDVSRQLFRNLGFIPQV